ncbi:EamA family transporter RarD [Paraburkholderia caballeronis]|uniref:Chloramphenicol-sensitive protein RarD n=1 Tax=Paraburkholderia caballeronis TaxID=416943 RepID=A0A1H7VSR5_9BURK|nr:EamA family transporter RarD [Paraburkholderia caballeronis]PXW15491.1 chloramphenicol-sensitive protein RarD [Paraburkholderia caballeronis]PXW93776.1 chloramphenicol-sensitive protein RarD [Paraburkholderia caballeronis]RAJ89016.1 chloramphenicol-sensitive protein RarD [Paraburkholderia caballeronis]SED99510.1 chloramphenicol-sensitive protein RarD [Paraburkholderia caballeronis]SEM11919.1 chloramphenicol-sensitive protein RarD [Paraburkholderia caballeronis]
MNQFDYGRGLAFSVGASALFALLSAYTLLLRPLGGLDIFAWRVVWTVPGALLLIALRGRWPQFRALVARMRAEPRVALSLAVTAALLGSQLWVFLWAPLHGRMLEVSLGYFLLPLMMVLVGRFHYHERLDGLQWAAVACAAAGVAHELWATHAFSWPTVLVMIGYPPYFMLRRRLRVDPMTAFAVEMTLLFPFAVFQAYAGGSFALLEGRALLTFVLLPGLGVLSTLALASWLKASRMLPMALFGILGYVEPVLLIVVSVTLLGEHLNARQLATYVPIWLAVALVALHSARLVRLSR